MGLLGKIIKRRGAEDAEDLDFEDEAVDSLDMPDEEGGSSAGIMGRVLTWRGKGSSKDTDEDEDRDEDEDADETDSDEYPSNSDAADTPDEDPPVQVVRLEGIPDVHPVGDSNTNMAPGQPRVPGDPPGPAPERNPPRILPWKTATTLPNRPSTRGMTPKGMPMPKGMTIRKATPA